jgi:hypothetical protein
MTQRHIHDIYTIIAALKAQIEPLCRELLPGGKRDGQEWRAGDLTGAPGQSVGVRLTGDRAGVWAEFNGGGSAGDALDLVAHCRFGGDKKEALRWARAWLGMGDDGRAFREQRPQVPAPKPRMAELDNEGRLLKARKIWLDAVPILGTPAEDYLAHRGIDFAQLGRAPGALRFAAKCWNAEVNAELPAMVAAINRRGEHVATHRTWLAQQEGRWTKAPLRAAKKVLGSYQGGAIAIWRGASARPLAQAPENDVVAICEGIEDALTLALHDPGLRVLAAISLSNLGNVQLPAPLTDLILAFDRDGENPAARAGRERAVRQYMEQGRSVREVFPAPGFKDFNAWHQAILGGKAA